MLGELWLIAYHLLENVESLDIAYQGMHSGE